MRMRSGAAALLALLFVCLSLFSGGGMLGLRALAYDDDDKIQMDEPDADPGSGELVKRGSSIRLYAESGARIYYTVDGNRPEEGVGSTRALDIPRSSTYATITVPSSAKNELIVMAYTKGYGEYSDSDVAIFTYPVSTSLSAVTATPKEGTVERNTEVKLSSSDGAYIYYYAGTTKITSTTTILEEGALYDDKRPIKLGASRVISAVAERDGYLSEIAYFTYTVLAQVAKPTANLVSGSVVAKGTKLTLSSTTSGVTIYHTLDGSDPSTSSTRRSGTEITLSQEEGSTVNIRAIATKFGSSASDEVSLSYTICRQEFLLAADPSADSVVKPGDTIKLSTALTGVEIRYTTDGTDPKTTSALGTSVTVAGDYGEEFVLKAVTMVPRSTAVSNPSTFRYSIIGRSQPPKASIPNGATVYEGARVELQAQGDIYYTLDGTDPTAASTPYGGPILLSGTLVLKTISVERDKVASLPAMFSYTLADRTSPPTADRSSGVVEIGTELTLSCTTGNAEIYYTLDGGVSQPTRENLADILKDMTRYTGPIAITKPVTLKMFAVGAGMQPSAVNTLSFTVSAPGTEEQSAASGEAPPPELEAGGGPEGNKLVLFGQFAGGAGGPGFTGIVLKDEPTGLLLTAESGALPPDVELTVRDHSPSPDTRLMVKEQLGLGAATVYDVALTLDGAAVQPALPESVELGAPIPEGCGDSVVVFCHVEGDTVTALPTRRSGGMAYAVVEELSAYVLAVSEYAERPADSRWPGALLVCGVCAGVTVGGALIWRRYRRESK